MPKALLTLLLTAMLLSPAEALIHPGLRDWSARLDRLLPSLVRTRAAEVADGLPLEATPAELLEALGAADLGGDPRRIGATCLYAGIRVLERHELVLVRFDERLSRIRAAEAALARYIHDVNGWLRTAPSGPPLPPSEALPPPSEGLPDLSEGPEGLHVFRLLPRPGPGSRRGLLRRLLDAAREDQRRVGAQADQTLEARHRFAEKTRAWRWHLRDLSRRLEPSTGAPRRAAGPGSTRGEPPLVEILPPPPPVALPPAPGGP